MAMMAIVILVYFFLLLDRVRRFILVLDRVHYSILVYCFAPKTKEVKKTKTEKQIKINQRG